MTNWGSPTGFDGCMCGEKDVCNQSDVVCNCNINDKTWRLDEGYVDDMSTLPVTKLQMGDTDFDYEEGYSTIGSLECTGAARDWNIVMMVHNDFCLTGYVLSTFKTVSSVQCANFCRRHTLCKSFNFKRSNDAGATPMICELNYKLLREVPENISNTISGCIYFEPK
ncbi:contactin-associated protein 1-like [Anneissia japonica]|uniref:contactin-associated protein 1-like n=1 Tax=Anneissia japonica TaxID=1529436 RepID=UPI0014256962|nr:contactin-associated protein 1-like [Anneissia japonica]